jgi:cytoskeleton protein RodZ
MPENDRLDNAPGASDGIAAQPLTAGKLLKAARERAGLHLGVLAVNLKVSVRQLEALEADQYPADQSPVFARGLAASFCRQLRIDPAPILALMPRTANYLEPYGAVRQALVAPADFRRVNRSPRGFQFQAWWTAGGMLVLIAALIWLPGPSQWSWLESVTAYLSPSEPEVRTVSMVPEASPLPAGSATDAAALGAVVGVPALTDASTKLPEVDPSLALNSLRTVPKETNTEASKPAALTPGPAPAQLLLAATQTSWVEVRDAKNQMIWSGVLNPGDTQRLSAADLMSVVVGRADAVQVTFKGQSFDLKPHTKANVARFEVKP